MTSELCSQKVQGKEPEEVGNRMCVWGVFRKVERESRRGQVVWSVSSGEGLFSG